MQSVAPDLKAVRERAVPKITIRAMAERLGMPPSTYAAYEDPKKFKKPILPLDLAEQIAGVLALRGIEPFEVLRLAGLTGEFTKSAYAAEDELWLPVSGVVAAGVWRAEASIPDEEMYEIKVGDPPYAGAERFVVRMEGYSMDMTIPAGADLECLRIPFSSVQPAPGDLVIVERAAHDLVELTCKRLDKDADGWLLKAESTKEEFREPIRIGTPDARDVTDDAIRVVGIVLSAHLDLAPRGLSRRRKMLA